MTYEKEGEAKPASEWENIFSAMRGEVRNAAYGDVIKDGLQSVLKTAGNSAVFTGVFLTMLEVLG